jgi:hypothetical protein
MVLTQEQEAKLVEIFVAWRENKEQSKALNHANSEMLAEIAKDFAVDKKQVGAAFRFRAKLEESGDDELSGIVDVFESMKK